MSTSLHAAASSSTRRGRVGRRVARVLLASALALATAELALQLAALFSRDRSSGARDGAAHRILCAGDSHTYGAGVPDADSYPTQLRDVLEQRAPGRYSVINVGVPGMSTTQVLNRLPEYVSRFRPEILVVWAGVNDSWNTSETWFSTGGIGAWLRGLASRSRLYRFYLVSRHELRLKRGLASAPERDGLRYKVETSEAGKFIVKANPNRAVTVYWDGGAETMRFEGRYADPDEAAARRAEADYEAMAAFARTAGVRLIFITYPIRIPGFEFANQAMRRVAERHGLELIDSTVSMERVPEEKRQWVALLHPTGPIYGEIAKDVAGRILGTPATGS